MKQPYCDRAGDASRVLTIPNLLSFFRIALIPLIVWLYCWARDYHWAAALIVLSGLTDLVDGYVARRFHMVSDLGKVLDPVADKLTQAAVLVCLATRFPLMLLPFALMVVKEVYMAVSGCLIIRRTGKVQGADWHGKVTTWLLYLTMVLHVLWPHLPPALSRLSIALCAAMILLSLVLYARRNHRLLHPGWEAEKGA